MIGPAAFRIDATALGIWLCPQAINENGMSWLKIASIRPARMMSRCQGRRWPSQRINADEDRCRYRVARHHDGQYGQFFDRDAGEEI